MADPALLEALEEALTDPTYGPARPTNLAEARAYFASNSALARAIVRLPAEGRLPARGSPRRRNYEAVLRAVQRAGPVRGGRERRSGRKYNPRAAEVARAPWMGAVVDANIARARRNGLRMRIVVTGFRISRTRRGLTTMPAGAVGISRFVHIAPEAAGPIMDLWEAGDQDQAADELLEAFFEAYELPGAEPDGFELVDLEIPPDRGQAAA